MSVLREENTSREDIQQYRGKTQRVEQKLRLQWPLKLFKLHDKCAENESEDRPTLKCMWVYSHY